MFNKIRDKWGTSICLIFPIAYFILSALSFNGFTALKPFLTVFSVVVIGFSVMALLNVLPGFIYNRKEYPAFFLCVAFVISYAISSVALGTNGFVENLKAICWLFACMICLYPTGIYSVKLEKEKKIPFFRIVCYVMMAYAGLAALGSLIILFGNFGDFVRPGVLYGVYGGRLHGVFTDPNYGGAFSAAMFSMSFFCILQGKKGRKYYWLYYINAALLYTYISFTVSRTAYVVLIIAIFAVGLYMIVSKKTKIWKKIVLALVCIVLCFGISKVREGYNYIIELKNKQTIEAVNNQEFPADEQPKIITPIERSSEIVSDFTNIRFLIWLDGISVIKKEPIFGVSYRNIQSYLRENVSDAYMINSDFDLDTFHNSILDVTASQGLVGLGILLAIVVVLFVRLFGGYKYLERADRDGVVFALIPVLVIMGASLMISDIFYINSPSTVTFWYLLGQVMGRLNNKKEEI